MKVLNVLIAPAVLMVPGLQVLQAPAVHAQQRDGVITGQVLDAVTGKPISAAAVVSITGPGIRVGPAVPPSSVPPRIVTGGDGRFVFRGCRDGSFNVTVIKGGYADGPSSRRRLGGSSQSILMHEAGRTADVTSRSRARSAAPASRSTAVGPTSLARASPSTTANSRSTIFPRAVTT